MRSSLLGLVVVFAGCGGSDVSRLLGARCDVTDECEDRCLAPSADFPDGFCSLDCSATSDCPNDADCIEVQGGVCLFACGDDVDCAFLGPGWACREELLREDTTVMVRVCRGA